MRCIETTDQLNGFLNHLMETTPLRKLNYPDVLEVFGEINRMGIRLALPKVHPSGLETVEWPWRTVVPFHGPFIGHGDRVNVDGRKPHQFDPEPVVESED